MKKYFFKHKWNVLLWMAFLLVGVGIDIYGAFLVERVTNTAMSGLKGQIIVLTCISITYVAVILANNYFEGRVGLRLRQKCKREIRNELFEKIMSLGQNTFNESNSAHYLSILTNDVQTSVLNYIYNVPKIVAEFVLMLGAAAVLFYYSPILAVVDIGVGVLVLFVPQITGKSIQEKQTAYSVSQENSMNTAKDFLQGFSVLKSFNAEARALKMYDGKTSEEAERYFQVGMAQTISYACSEGFSWLTFGVHEILAAYLVVSGNLTLGAMFGSMQVLNHVVFPISRIVNMMAEMKAAQASNKRIMEILDLNSEETSLEEIQNVFPIRLEHAGVSYDEGAPVLKDISYTFEEGKKYAIVGPSGSGKSTLLKLLLKYFPDYEGKLYYGNMEAAGTDRRSINDNISYIQQNVIIFNDSIKENITMFTDVDDGKLKDIVTRAGLDGVIGRFPEGLGGMLEEEGKNLSGGERQRISIARAFVKESPVLLVDEATASLDNITARQIEESVLNDKDCTAIVITHKLDESVLRQYDKILVLIQGEIAEEGTFEELMEQKKKFYSLFRIEN